MAESFEQAESTEDRILSLENTIKQMREELSLGMLKLEGLPSQEDMGYELPITRFEADKDYFKFQKDGVNLTLMFNPDGLKRNLSGGGIGGGSSSTSLGGPFWGRIAGATSTGVVDARGNPVQWLYSIVQLSEGPVEGYDEFVNNPDGFIGAAYNAKEDDNTGIGVQGNGIDVDGSIFTDNSNLMFQPIRDVVIFWICQAQDGAVFARFCEPNSVDGSCGSGSG